MYLTSLSSRGDKVMKKTKKTQLNGIENQILLDTNELRELLSCGKYTAVKIGEAAQAKVKIGKRVLWNKALIQNYVNEIAV